MRLNDVMVHLGLSERSASGEAHKTTRAERRRFRRTALSVLMLALVLIGLSIMLLLTDTKTPALLSWALVVCGVGAVISANMFAIASLDRK